MQNGFIYLAFDWLIQKLTYLNLVEVFKTIIVKYLANKSDLDDVRKKSRIAADLFQIFKWILIAIFIVYGASSITSRYVVYYLIASNLFTYFYYHVWGSNHFQGGDRDYVRSRFMNAILAVAYFLICYSYLYLHQFQYVIAWPNDEVDWVNSIYLSVTTAFTLTYEGFQPKSQGVRILFMTELLNTFVFFTIILSSSVPNPVTKDK